MTIYEKILAGLKTKFNGVEDATLQRIASKKSEGVTDESKVDSILEGISFQNVLESYGDFRADGASKTAKKNAIAEYEQTYKLKDGKPIDPPTPPAPPTPPTPPKGETEKALTADDVKKMVAESVGDVLKNGLAEALKPINDRFSQMDEAQKKAQFDARVDEVAKSFDIPAFAYKGKTIDEKADLNVYFGNLKQEMVNAGFKFASAPQVSTQQQQENDAKSIASMINQGTEELNKK